MIISSFFTYLPISLMSSTACHIKKRAHFYFLFLSKGFSPWNSVINASGTLIFVANSEWNPSGMAHPVFVYPSRLYHTNNQRSSISFNLMTRG